MEIDGMDSFPRILRDLRSNQRERATFGRAGWGMIANVDLAVNLSENAFPSASRILCFL